MFINYACSVLVASNETKAQSTCLNRHNLTGSEHTISKACKIDLYVYNSPLYSIYVILLRNAAVNNAFKGTRKHFCRVQICVYFCSLLLKYIVHLDRLVS